VVTNGVFTVSASGNDIWNMADAFQFVYETNGGDCAIIARVPSVQNTNAWSKAGVMIRESLASNAANAFIAVTPGNGVLFQYRSSTGGTSISNNVTGISAPYWVKLTRSGNTFTGYCSPDGTNWTQQGTATFTMASTAYVGLAVTARNNSSLCAATFDNVSAPGWPIPPPSVPTGLTATRRATTSSEPP
jgi:regulation of enolase protein 1 (concanavalin A-like superfamily)